VELLGGRYGAEKWDFLSSIDIFCSPSADESFGVSIVEAALSGAAVVSSGACGALEYFDDSQVLRVDATVSDVGAALDLLVREPRIRWKLAIAARRRARSAFEAPAVGRELHTFYRSLSAGDCDL
jgi:glycosyltransferase involved in cell wall biosynthesis